MKLADLISISNEKESVIYSYNINSDFLSFINIILSYFKYDKIKTFDSVRNDIITINDMKETVTKYDKVIIFVGDKKAHILIYMTEKEKLNFWSYIRFFHIQWKNEENK